jgi:adenylyltransferase/sulfurtransferase
VLAPVPGVIGTMMAVETLKFLAAVAGTRPGQLSLYDAMSAKWQQVAIKKRKDCPGCS